ncbi:MAG: autotransporter outer membrane beta-barrel domain-containing protein [Bacteroidota bacterium]
MEDHHDELGDFIRKQLRQATDPDDDWDRPDPTVWEGARAQLSPPLREEGGRGHYWHYWRYWAIGLFLLSLLVNAYLLYQQGRVKTQLDQQMALIHTLQAQIDSGQSAPLPPRPPAPTGAGVVAESPPSQAFEPSPPDSPLDRRAPSAPVVISPVLAEPPSLVPRARSATQDSLAPISPAAAAALSKELPPLPRPLLDPLAPPTPDSLTSQLTIIPSRELAPRPARWELAIQYGRLNLNVPKAVPAKPEDLSPRETTPRRTAVYHFQLARSLRPNWWLKTGLRYAAYDRSHQFEFRKEYDAAKEFTKADGSTANAFELEMDDGLFRSTQAVQVDIPAGLDLETGNLIFGEFSERQRLNLWQVPLGIEYRQASKRLAWQLELGAILNVLQAGAPEWTGRVYSSQQALATEISSKREAGTDRKVQWGLEGGMGLHYRLLPRLTLRGDLLYQLNPNFNQQSLQVGLGYLF